MTTLTLPAGLPTPLHTRAPKAPTSYDDGRRYEWVWLLGDLPGRMDLGEDENAVKLTIRHTASYKSYEASVKAIRQYDGGTSERFVIGNGPDLGGTIASERTGRYSAKALAAFAQTVLDGFPDCIPADTVAATLWAQIVTEQSAGV